MPNGSSSGVLGEDMKDTPPPGNEGGDKSSTAWHNTRKMIYVKSNAMAGFWPVPESFWPDTLTSVLVSQGSYQFLPLY